MIRTLIIDDEPHCVSALLHDLNRLCPQVDVVATCRSAEEGIEAIRKHDPELVFLDIEMPVMDGFEMLEALGEGRGFQVVFTTAYDDFMLKAIRVNAMDYLLKPVDGADLIEAVSRVERHIMANTSLDKRINSLLQQLRPADDQRIALPNQYGYEFIDSADILYAKADGAYTRLFFADGHDVLFSKSLGEIEAMLPSRTFIRIHHSVIVNVNKVSHFRKLKTSVVVMSNGDSLNVSRSRKEALLQRMGAR